MKTVILAAILGVAASARLDNLAYLPPSQRTNNGGGFDSSFGVGGPSGPLSKFARVPILKFNADNSGEGSYRYNYETGHGITAQEQGDARGDGTKAQGSYSYISPEGEHISITYTADENGFVPQGSHIPTPPPIPEAILKSLQENAAAEARGVFDDGQYRGEGLNEGQYRGEGQGSGFGGYAANGGYSTNGAYAANGGYKY